MLFLTTFAWKISKGGPDWSASALLCGGGCSCWVPRFLPYAGVCEQPRRGEVAGRGKRDKGAGPQRVEGSLWCELWLRPVTWWLQTSVGAGGGAWQWIELDSAARCNAGSILVPSVTGGEEEAC